MPRGVRDKHLFARAYKKRRRRYRRKRTNLSNKAPTHKMGHSPQYDLVMRTPLFPRGSKRVKLFYYEYGINRAGTAGAITNYFYIANGCYDPNITGTGHQPLGFDEMTRYYNQYTVVRSKISVCFINNGVQSVRVGIALTPDTTNQVIGDNVENGLMKMAICDSPAYNVGFGNGQRVKTLTLNCDVASYFGRRSSRELLNTTNMSGTIAANPTEAVYFDVQTWGGHFTDNTTVNIDVVIEYDVIFWEPKKVPQQ